MSWRQVESVLEQSKSRNAARLVLTVLATCANDQGVCWPGVESVMRKARVCRTAIHKAFQKLTTLGELQIDIGAGAKGCNVYRILLPLPKNGPSQEVDSPSQKVDPPKKRTLPDSDTGGATKREDPSQKVNGPLPNSGPEPSGNRQRSIKEPSETSSSSTTPTLSQPQAVGGKEEEDEELNHLEQDELWRRVCRIVGRPPDQPRTAGEELALQESDFVSAADMQLLERHAAFEYTRKGRRGKRTARTLLANLNTDLKDAWVWSRTAPAASEGAGAAAILAAQVPAVAQPITSAEVGLDGAPLALEVLWQRVCQLLGRPPEKPRTQPEQNALVRCSTWLGEAGLQLLEAFERRKHAHLQHRSETAYNFLTFAETRVREINSRRLPSAGVSPSPRRAAAPLPPLEPNTQAADNLLAPDELWQRVCQVVKRPADRIRDRKEQFALDQCIDVWASDMRLLENYAAWQGMAFGRTAHTLLQCMRAELNRAQEWEQRRRAATAASSQPAPATNGHHVHRRPTVEEVFAYISKVGWKKEVAQAYIEARTRTDPPWHLPATYDRPARPISADWHPDVDRFLTNWIEVEKKKAEQRDMELF